MNNNEQGSAFPSALGPGNEISRDNVKINIGKLNTKINQDSVKIKSLQNEVTSLQNQIISLQNQVASLQNQVSWRRAKRDSLIETHRSTKKAQEKNIMAISATPSELNQSDGLLEETGKDDTVTMMETSEIFEVESVDEDVEVHKYTTKDKSRQEYEIANQDEEKINTVSEVNKIVIPEKIKNIPESIHAKHFKKQHIDGIHRMNKPVNTVANFGGVGVKRLRISGRRDLIPKGLRHPNQAKYVLKEEIPFEETGFKRKGQTGTGKFVLTGQQVDSFAVVVPEHLDGRPVEDENGKIVIGGTVFSQCSQSATQFIHT